MRSILISTLPAKNTIKTYIENGYYHVYNRGVEKRNIFEDSQDYAVFLKNLKIALSPQATDKLKPQGASLRFQTWEINRRKNFSKNIDLLAYALMPNHFHFLIKQKQKESMESFMRSLMTKYSIYFNKKYDRVGKLFQGHYKAIMIENDSYLLHLSRYIHLNPSEISEDLINTYSSYSDYLQITNTSWVNTEIILPFFNQQTSPDFIKATSYKQFVEGNSTFDLTGLTLEE